MRILLCIIAASFLISWDKQSGKNDDLELLRKFCTFSNDTSYADAESFCKIFPEKIWGVQNIVACGQSSHGSHENFQIQKMIYEYMVEKKECRIFLMEASYSALLAVNRYVQNNVGTKESVMKSLGFWVWQTEEVWDLIEWTRKFNNGKRSFTDKVMFLGIDLQDMTAASGEVLKFFSDYNPEVVQEATEVMKPFLNDTVFKKAAVTPELIADYHDRIKTIKKLILQTDQRDKTPKPFDYLLERRNGELMEQALLWKQGVFAEQYARRDSMMADNVKWVMENKILYGPVFLWAHNGHVFVEKINHPKYPYKSLGAYLRNYYGEKYYNIGIDFISGSFNARVSNQQMKILPCTAGENSKQSLDYQIAQFNSGITFFNLDSAKEDAAFPESTLYKKDMVMHDYGAVFYGNKYQGAHIDVKIEQFNALIFFQHSTPTQLIQKK